MTRTRISGGAAAALLGASIALWVSCGALTVADDAGVSRIGLLPSLVWLVLLIATALLIAAVARPRARRVSVAALSLLAVLPWIPLRAPAAAVVWTGHIRLWLWLAIAIALVAPARRQLVPTAIFRAAADPRRAPWLAAALAAAMYLAAARQVSPQLPTGDEPHYLVITQSLLEDHDLRIENNHRQGDYRAYFHAALKPDFQRWGKDGQIYSIHAPGLPALVAPAFALFGYPGVMAFLALISAWATALAWVGAWRVTRDAAASWFGWATIALSVPFFFQSFVVFPDAPGAAITMVGVLTLIAGRGASERSLLGTGALLALLPWLHTRFAVVAAVLGLLIAARNIGAPAVVRRLAALLAIPGISAVAWFGFFYIIYGTPSPAAPYENTQTSLANIPRGLTGLLFDQQFGLIPNAPVYLCAAAGVFVMMRRQARLALELFLIVIPYVLVAVAFQMWWAGNSSPARFLVLVVLPLTIPAAVWFAAAGRGARVAGLGALLLSLLITAALAGVNRGALLYNVRQEEAARWLAWISPLVNVATGVPSFFQNPPAVVLAHAAIWAVACAATVWTGVAIGRSSASIQTVALGVGASAATAAMLALSIVWHSNHAQPLTPAAGSLELLRQYDGGGIAVRYPPLHRVAIADLPSLLVLDSRIVDTSPLARPLLLLTHPPAATYEIEATVSGSAATRVTATVDREFGPQWSWDLHGATGVWRQTLTLPLSVASLAVDAAADTRRALGSISIRASHVPSARDRLTSEQPVHATRLRSAVLFLLAGHAYTEAAGTWIGGGDFGEFIVSPDPATPIRLFVRNAPVRNQVTLESGDWRQAMTLEPREERLVDIPTRNGINAALVRVTTTAGARPSDLDRTNTDTRLLGCWIEVR